LSTSNGEDYITDSGSSVTNNSGDAFAVDGGPKSITVTKPSNASHVHTGEPFDVKWNVTGNISKKVRIELFRGPNKVETIVMKTKYNRKFRWDVPDSLSDGSNYRIRVVDKANGVSDKSDAFTIESH
jgi:hypothetical protein